MYRATNGLGADEPISVQATRPTWCPGTAYSPTDPPRDPCETAYKIDMPIIGERTIKLPVSQLVYDALKSGANALPAQMPALYAAVSPYVDRVKSDVVADIEYRAPILGRRLLDQVVMPKVDEVLAEAERIKWQSLLGIGAMTVVLTAAVGGAAWWIRKNR